MNYLVIQGGRVIDPSQDLDQVADVVLGDGTVVAIGPDLDAPADSRLINATGKVVAPGLIQMLDNGEVVPSRMIR